jgi:MYXO-CTERM domain-containing protein
MYGMRSLFAGLVALCAIATAGDALADVGPAPKCPAGTHSAYLKGRRCVKDGYVLRENAEGHVEEVATGQPVASPRSPVPANADSPSDSPVTPPPSEATPSSPPPAPKAGGCSTTARGAASTLELGLGLFTALGLLLLARRRRVPAMAAEDR